MQSVMDLFEVGIGPSSSHTVGPMKAAKHFLSLLSSEELCSVFNVKIDLYGSLALTGHGHCTDVAILLGLLGEDPDTVCVEAVQDKVRDISDTRQLCLLNKHLISFSSSDIVFNKRKSLPEHPNAMTFTATNKEGVCLFSETYFSIGGGFIKTRNEMAKKETPSVSTPLPFSTAETLLSHCDHYSKAIWEVTLDNELYVHSKETLLNRVRLLWTTMKECVRKGCSTEGVLPGGLKVKRRAYGLYQKLKGLSEDMDPTMVFDWVSVFALAVNEENAAGGRVVTAPTNGAAGIIPAILHYYEHYFSPLSDDQLLSFFLTAGAIGSLYKMNASISGAEMGCQGEIGVASSMAAAGLTQLHNGTVQQIECAAEIAMEHHLGMTCDPIKGLVQIPCIERNTMGAIKAINASKLALYGEGKQKVSLDKVIRTMKQTGDDMKKRYKETSKGGLAINVIEC